MSKGGNIDCRFSRCVASHLDGAVGRTQYVQARLPNRGSLLAPPSAHFAYSRSTFHAAPCNNSNAFPYGPGSTRHLLDEAPSARQAFRLGPSARLSSHEDRCSWSVFGAKDRPPPPPPSARNFSTGMRSGETRKLRYADAAATLPVGWRGWLGWQLAGDVHTTNLEPGLEASLRPAASAASTNTSNVPIRAALRKAGQL